MEEKSVHSGKMSKIEVRPLKEDEYGLWNDIVERSPHATVTHELDWLKIIEKHSGSKLYLFTGNLGNEIVAAIPFFYRRKHFIRTLSSPIGGAMIQNLGPIIPDYDTLKQDKREFYFREFQKELDECIKKELKPNIISIVTPPNLLDARPYVWNNYQVVPRYNYIKNIENLDEVQEGLKKQLRKNIKNAEKAGLIVEEGGSEEYNFIINSVSNRLDEQDIDFSTSKEYLLDIYNRYYPENLKVFIARLNGELITGIIVTAYRDKLSIWVGATQVDLKGIYPVDLIQWKIIEWGNKNGYKFCEILGANMPSISYFKSRYNFDLEIYFSINRADMRTSGMIKSFQMMKGLGNAIKKI
ncbi:MAG TPA: GNAT family N-acetyltransferase [Methanothrix sp.]|nr:GNAT family N-acetyltransferase [Methanothrix sp.]